MKQNHIIKEISKQPNGCYNVQLPAPSVKIRIICIMPLFKLYACASTTCREDEVDFV